MGLGPWHSSLLARCSGLALVYRDPFAMLLEQLDRAAQRKAKAIWHRMKHKAVKKSEAPVEAMPKQKGHLRGWRWIGETLELKGLRQGIVYQADQIRKAGFKLPKLVRKQK